MEPLKGEERYSNRITWTANEDPKSSKRKRKSGASKRKSDNKKRASKVLVTPDMWKVIKNKKIYGCPFTPWIDGWIYNHSKISVFEPQDVFDKIKNELDPYFENFPN